MGTGNLATTDDDEDPVQAEHSKQRNRIIAMTVFCMTSVLYGAFLAKRFSDIIQPTEVVPSRRPVIRPIDAATVGLPQENHPTVNVAAFREEDWP